jgi:hypothetical protein
MGDQQPMTILLVDDETRCQHVDGVMHIASHLVGRDEIGAIHVVTNERPTYADLLRFREVADANEMTLIVEAGAVVLRPVESLNTVTSEQSPGPTLETTSQSHFPRAVWHWVHDHAAAVIALFAGLTEGVR